MQKDSQFWSIIRTISGVYCAILATIAYIHPHSAIPPLAGVATAMQPQGGIVNFPPALFLGLIAMALSVAIPSALDVVRHRKHIYAYDPAQKIPQGIVSIVNALPSGPSATPAPKRIILGQAPAELVAPYKSHTSSQAKALTAVYAGKWLKVSGILGDVSSHREFMTVTFEDSMRTHGVLFFHMRFGEQWFDHLSVLKRGSAITVLGKVAEIAFSTIALEDCELAGEGGTIES